MGNETRLGSLILAKSVNGRGYAPHAGMSEAEIKKRKVGIRSKLSESFKIWQNCFDFCQQSYTRTSS